MLDEYIATALWSEGLDDRFGPEDLASETREIMGRDCERFAELVSSLEFDGHFVADCDGVGHDFWLTRNGHGAGFWDGDWDELGDELTKIAESFGTCDLYVGDDKLIYCI